MLLKRTVDGVRSDLERHAEKISGGIDDMGEVVALALLVVGTIAVAALVIALTTDAGGRR